MSLITIFVAGYYLALFLGGVRILQILCHRKPTLVAEVDKFKKISGKSRATVIFELHPYHYSVCHNTV